MLKVPECSAWRLCCIQSESVALLQLFTLYIYYIYIIHLIICCLYGYTQECGTDKCFLKVPSVSYGKLRSSFAWKAWGTSSGQWKPRSMEGFSCICNFTLSFHTSSDNCIMLELVNTATGKFKHYPWNENSAWFQTAVRTFCIAAETGQRL